MEEERTIIGDYKFLFGNLYRHFVKMALTLKLVHAKRVMIGIYMIMAHTYALRLLLPYHQARINMAYNKYMETTLYRDRLIEMGENFARMAFIEYDETELFLKKLTWKDKMKAFFVSYNYIGGQE